MDETALATVCKQRRDAAPRRPRARLLLAHASRCAHAIDGRSRRGRTAGRPNSAVIGILGWLTLAVSPASAQQRVYYQSFDDVSQVEDFWFEPNNSAKSIVGAADGAVVHRGSCLRGNWQQAITDPITQLTTSDNSYCRYAGYELRLDHLGIVDEVYLDYWAYVDDDATKAYGAKWIWLQGTNLPPGVYNQRFNFILQPPWGGWDTWRLANNNPTVGEPTSSAKDRSAVLSKIPGIQSLLQGQSVNEWFQGRWHHFQVHMRLNTPASQANGVFKFWLDGVLVLDFDDFRFRDLDHDHIARAITPHMYGGADPPPGTFGWQLDELQIWDGIPSPKDGGVDQGTPSDAGVDSLGDALSTDAPMADDGGTSGDAYMQQDGTRPTDAAVPADTTIANATDPTSALDGGCGCTLESPIQPHGLWLTIALLLLTCTLHSRRQRRRAQVRRT